MARAPVTHELRVVTREWLESEAGCADQVRLFVDTFGDVAEVTAENLHRANARGLDVAWWVERVLPKLFRAKYKRQVAPLWTKYKRREALFRAKYECQEAPFRAEYKRQVAPFWAKYEFWEEYQRQEAPFWAEYKRRVVPLWAEYQRRAIPLWAEYQRQEVNLLIRLLGL